MLSSQAFSVRVPLTAPVQSFCLPASRSPPKQSGIPFLQPKAYFDWPQPSISVRVPLTVPVQGFCSPKANALCSKLYSAFCPLHPKPLLAQGQCALQQALFSLLLFPIQAFARQQIRPKAIRQPFLQPKAYFDWPQPSISVRVPLTVPVQGFCSPKANALCRKPYSAFCSLHPKPLLAQGQCALQQALFSLLLSSSKASARPKQMLFAAGFHQPFAF